VFKTLIWVATNIYNISFVNKLQAIADVIGFIVIFLEIAHNGMLQHKVQLQPVQPSFPLSHTYLKNQFQYYPFIYVQISAVASSFEASWQSFFRHLLHPVSMVHYHVIHFT
jgi:hypothetical protein